MVAAQQLISEESLDSFIGALEYERDGPKRTYRQYLSQSAHMQEVVPLKSEKLRFKIKQTYCLGYLKVRRAISKKRRQGEGWDSAC